MEEMRNVYSILVVKPEGKKPLGSPRSRWEDNNRMDLKETVWEAVDRMYLAQDRDQWQTLGEHVNEPSVSIKCWKFLD
jgi:hypothetical protein